MEELNRKLAKWRWPNAQVYIPSERHSGVGDEIRVRIDGQTTQYELFTSSLDACFRWLEPPLYERFGIYHIGFARVVGVGYNCYMNRRAVNWPYREEGRSKELTTLGHGESLGAAFCDAAWKVINKYPELESPLPTRLRSLLASPCKAIEKLIDDDKQKG